MFCKILRSSYKEDQDGTCGIYYKSGFRNQSVLYRAQDLDLCHVCRDSGNREGESGPHSILIPAGGMGASMREDNQWEESDILSPRGRKRTTSEDLKTKVSKREKKSSPDGPASEGILAAQ